MRPLTKSRYKLALDCPTKLYYIDKEDVYENQKEEDAFLQSLAEGGYQVGELAKCYYPGGHNITESGYEIPVNKTNKLLKQKNVIIYEAAILYQNFFIRVDVLEKYGNKINLIEVKAKSFSGNTDDFINSKGFIEKDWSLYLEDVAFQKYVIQKAFPDWEITAFLMLADKSAKASINGLNQKFQLVKDKKGRTFVKTVGDVSPKALGKPILKAVNVDYLANKIINDEAYPDIPLMPYEDKLNFLSEKYSKDEKIISPVGLHCFSCEFQSDLKNKKSGLKECWSKFYNWTEEEFNKPKITEIWNFRKKKQLFEDGIIFIDQIQKNDIGDINLNSDGTLSVKERQWLQVKKVQNNDTSFYFDKNGMKNLMSTFTYPLHFIDFETSMVAIPFYKGQHPYEQIAFQFSHHIMYENGKVEHKGEFIETIKGKFPNFDFLRALKKQLENDKGTIFRYASHENTVLNQICNQLNMVTKSEVADKDELIEFIYSITHDNNRKGERDMVDMLMMVKHYYYDPLMGGSNSIKVVLPAVLESSIYIRNRYSKPIYGRNSEIKSLNFDDGWIWIRKDNDGKIISPYKLLPKLFDDLDDEIVKNFISDDILNVGGAALTAFAKMQFTEISKIERERLIKGLLKYCELDTLAMVMIYEFWLNEINNTLGKNLEFFGTEYKKTHLKEFSHDTLSKNGILAFKFFLKRAFVRGRRDKLSHDYFNFTWEILKERYNFSESDEKDKNNKKWDEIFKKIKEDYKLLKENYELIEGDKSFDKKGIKLLKEGNKNILKRDDNNEGFVNKKFEKLYKTNELIQSLTTKNSKIGREINNGSDLLMILDVLKFISENEERANIYLYILNKINSNNIKKVYDELRKIYEIGPKIASLIIRDIVLINEIKIKIKDNLQYIFPVDTWVKKTFLNINNNKENDKISSLEVEKFFEKEGFSGSNIPLIAAGVWYLAINSLDILIKIIEVETLSPKVRKFLEEL